jgi:hypothetical protein
VLVKWWLLALPQYLVIGFFNGGNFGWGRGDDWGHDAGYGPGLIFLMVVFGSVTLLFTTRYPAGIFNFVVGMNRWVFRVIAYATLMTDRYPPFRLDQGPAERPVS